MKYRITFVPVLAAALLFALPLRADAEPAPTPAGEAAIKEAVLATNAAMIAEANRLDMDAFFAYIIDGPSPVVQNGMIFPTRTAAKEAVSRGLKSVAKIERRIDNPVVTVIGPDAVLLVGDGSVNATLEDGRTMNSWFAVSLVFVRRDGKWKVLHGHYSMIPAKM